MSKIFLIGGTGLVGTKLQKKLLENGHVITIYTRKRIDFKAQNQGITMTDQIDQNALAHHDVVINLAGAGIFDHAWTKSRKLELVQSRVTLTQNLTQALNLMEISVRPKLLIQISAIGYYGTSWTKSFTEDSPAGDDFLAALCQDWEQAAKSFLGKVSIARLGIVLSRDGGMLMKILPLFRFLLGGPLDSGKQWISWIHIDDAVDILVYLLTADPQTYNVVAPQTVRQEAFAKTLGSLMGRPSFVPTSGMMLRLLLGERAHYLITGQKVLPDALIKKGYKFQYKNLRDALSNLL
ncbi:MAG: TIGR01777 family oxidoreductase [Pseudomonadota bacterium]